MRDFVSKLGVTVAGVVVSRLRAYSAPVREYVADIESRFPTPTACARPLWCRDQLPSALLGAEPAIENEPDLERRSRVLVTRIVQIRFE